MTRMLYIGNVRLCPKNEQYTLELPDGEYERLKRGKELMTGTVVEKGEECPYYIGQEGSNFINPFLAMKEYGFPVFVKI